MSSLEQSVLGSDLFPLAELAGLPPPTGPQVIDGLSLAPVVRDPANTIRDHAYHCHPRGERMGRAIRTEHYRLVEWKTLGAAASSAEFELYDYQTEPGESKNLARSQPALVSELRRILPRHLEAVLLPRK